MNQVAATCWMCLLLSAFLFEPVLSKGGRGGSRGSSRGTSARSSNGGNGGSYGGTRSRPRAGIRSSPVRVAAAAAAGAAVALTAEKWYASAYRRSNADSSGEDLDYYNRTYFDAQISTSSTSTRNGSWLTQVSIIIATFFPNYGYGTVLPTVV